MNILEDFGAVTKHLFKKIDFITKAQSLLYRWHNSDNLKLYEKCATKGGGFNTSVKSSRDMTVSLQTKNERSQGWG